MSNIQIATFLYHEVTDDPTDSGIQRPSASPYKHTQHAFLQNLHQIATSHVRPGLVTDIDFTKPGMYMLLTFDDGGKSAVHVSDELNKQDWTGHFFIVTSWIGSRTFLNPNEIKYIRSCGHIIGSHSHTHPDIFKALSFEEMVTEWRVSCSILSQLLGEPCISASVPCGDVSPAVPKSADAVGIRYLFTSDPRLSPQKVRNCWVLGRACPKVSTSPSRVRDLAHFHGWTKALAVRRFKVLAKIALSSVF